MNNATDISMKFTNSVTGQGKIDKYIERLSSLKRVMESMPKTLTLSTDVSKELNTINKLLVNLNKNVSSFKKEMISALGSIKKGEKNAKNLEDKLEGAFDYVKIRRFIAGMQTLSRVSTELVKKSADYLENINLFEVAYNGAYQEAERLVNKLSEMYGLDESQLTNMVGIFRQLANAMGLAVETSDKLAELLTYMAIDVSSLYNMDLENASSVLQSSLAGQTKPIRGATGADITQHTLQQTLTDIGVDRYIADLSYAEKRLVIIISLTRQLKEATNDFGKTIESPANQMRILNEQWERLGRAVGNVLLQVFEPLLPVLNGVVMALTEIINYIAILLGYDPDKYDYLGGVSDSVLDLEDGLGNANEQAKKLRQTLRGFDKLNVIKTPSAGDEGNGMGGIDPDILNAFNKSYDDYLKKIEEVQMRATKIRDSIMEWLGFTKEIDEETGKVSFKFDHITGGTVLGGLAVGGFIYSGVKGIFDFFNKLGLLSFFKSPLFTKGLTWALTITGMTITSDAIAGLLDEGSTWENVFKSLGGALALGAGTFILTKSVTLTLLVTSIALVTEAFLSIKDAWGQLGPIIEENGGFWQNWKEGCLLIIDNISEGISNLKETIVNKFNEIGLKLAGNEEDWELWKTLLGTMWDVVTLDFFGLYKRLEQNFLDLKNVIDENGGFWQNWVDGINLILEDLGLKKFFTKSYWSEKFSGIVSGAGAKLDELKTKFETWKANIKTPHLKWSENGAYSASGWVKSVLEALNLPTSIPKLNVEWYAKGGLPQVGQLFVANEQGPELVGQIGGQSFVANQNQMMDLLDKKIGSAGSPINATFIVQVGDEEVARKVINNLQDMAKSSGKPIKIG
jgi:hypothetical protein